VHPTKREVHFLNEEAITERICDAIQKALATQVSSRTFEYQVTYSPLHLPSDMCVVSDNGVTEIDAVDFPPQN